MDVVRNPRGDAKKTKEAARKSGLFCFSLRKRFESRRGIKTARSRFRYGERQCRTCSLQVATLPTSLWIRYRRTADSVVNNIAPIKNFNTLPSNAEIPVFNSG